MQFFLKVVCVDNKFSKPIVVYRGENASYRFIEAILKVNEYFKRVMKKHFNKNLIMTEKEEENLWLSNTCWICEKLIDDEKSRDHCHITGKYRGAANWSCNVNLQLAKNFFIILHNVKEFDSCLIRLIMSVTGTFDVKVQYPMD